MTEIQFRKILCDAMVEEYKWVPAPENLKYNYTFSSEFEKKMKEMAEQYGSEKKQATSLKNPHTGQRRENEYIRVGRHAFRKMTVAVLVAIMMLALAACAVYFGITWYETENLQRGTLDVSFGTDDSYNTNKKFIEKRPEIPKGFEIVSELEYPEMLRVQYKSHADETTIDYVQERTLDTMEISIDSDDESFAEIKVNNHKGYAVTDGVAPYIIWSDGEYLYYLSGNVSYEILRKTAESIK